MNSSNSRTTLVWDVPLRLFHWLLAISVAGALITTQLGWMTWHGRFGLSVLGLLTFRLVWGLVGSTHARFWNFITGPAKLVAYLRGDYRPVGHNPLGALSVIAILLVLGFQATSGLFATDDIAYSGPLRQAVNSATSTWLTGWHMRMEWVIYGLVALHIAAVLFHVLVRRETLIRPMFTGRKPMTSGEDARGGGWLVFLIAAAITTAVLWIANGALLPEPPPPPPDLGW